MITLHVRSDKRSQAIDITDLVQQEIAKYGYKDGFCLLYVPHTTAGIFINEGADPAVMEDILNFLEKLVPWNDNYRHMEGNAAAHIKSSLTGNSISLIVENGKICLGTWQKIFFLELDGPRKRKVWLKLM